MSDDQPYMNVHLVFTECYMYFHGRTAKRSWDNKTLHHADILLGDFITYNLYISGMAIKCYNRFLQTI